jgi:hypothetical protein
MCELGGAEAGKPTGALVGGGLDRAGLSRRRVSPTPTRATVRRRVARIAERTVLYASAAKPEQHDI